MKIRTLFSIVWIHIKEFLGVALIPGFRRKPYKVLLQITDRCNSKCGHCSIWKVQYKNPDFHKQELAMEDYEKFFQDYGDNILWLTVSGGEITTFPEIERLFLLVHKYCRNLRILGFTTNALEVERALEIAQLVRANNWDPLITISLDGDQKLHDEIRGVPGNFEKALLLKKLLKENRIHANFGFTIINRNVEFLAKFYKFWNSDIKAINSSYSDGIYGKKNLVDPKLEQQALKQVIKHYQISSFGEIIEYVFIRLNSLFIENFSSKSPLPCTVLESSVHITPQGQVHGCMFLPSVGSLKNDKFEDLMVSPAWSDQKSLIKKGQCPQCWMNCYGPHSIMRHPIQAIRKIILN